MLSVTVTLYPDRLREGIMLAATQESMRIALRGATDIVELRRVKNQWLTDDDQPVDFEVLLYDGHAEIDLFSETTPRTMAAGRA